MEPLALWLIGLVAGGLAWKAATVLGGRLRRRRPARELDAHLRWAFGTAAARAGLAEVEEADSSSAPPSLQGRAGRFGVALRQIFPGERAAAEVRVNGLGHGSPGLSVRRQPRISMKRSRLEMEETELWLGDEELEMERRALEEEPLPEEEPDGAELQALRRRPRIQGAGFWLEDKGLMRELCVLGDIRLAFALLDRKSCSKLLALVRGSILVEGEKPLAVSAALAMSTLTVKLVVRRSASREELAEQVFAGLRAALELAPLLVAPEDLAARLGQRLLRESRAEVRRRILAVLKSDFPDHPATAKAFADARADRSREVRALVTEVLGPEEPATLRRLVDDHSTPGNLAADAVKALGKTLPAEAALATLRRALAQRQRVLVQACIRRLKRRPELRQQELLLAVLDFLPTGREALFVARALGSVGTAVAVPALRALERKGSALLVEAARQSIAEIQARLVGAEAGQLSVAGSEAGALTLTEEGEAGRVSLVDEEERANE